jgi:hypothetical protein
LRSCTTWSFPCSTWSCLLSTPLIYCALISATVYFLCAFDCIPSITTVILWAWTAPPTIPCDIHHCLRCTPFVIRVDLHYSLLTSGLPQHHSHRTLRPTNRNIQSENLRALGMCVFSLLTFGTFRSSVCIGRLMQVLRMDMSAGLILRGQWFTVRLGGCGWWHLGQHTVRLRGRRWRHLGQHTIRCGQRHSTTQYITLQRALCSIGCPRQSLNNCKL